MTLTKRLLSLSFDRRGERPTPGTCVPSSGITCTPWEGLYLPHGDGDEENHGVSITDQELERFLSSLTSGE